MPPKPIRIQNNAMNGWYWDYNVLRRLVHELGYHNEEIFDVVNRIKAENNGHRYGKGMEQILADENDLLFPTVRYLEHQFPGLEPGISKLSESGNLHHALSNSMAAFVVVKSKGVAHVNGGKDHTRVPVTDLRGFTRTLQNFYINFEDPPIEILQSIVGKPRERYGGMWPSRILFTLDVEYFSTDPHRADNDIGIFHRLEPARKIIEKKLASYGIPHSCIMTGRGYHFISQVMGSSPFMQHLVEEGSALEETVRWRADSGEMRNRAGYNLPHSAEAAYKAITRLQQYFFSTVIRGIRRKSSVRVEISDRGGECIVLDNTSQLRDAHNGNIAVPSSPYEKFYKSGGRVMARLNRSHNRREWISVEKSHHIRRYMDSSLEFLGHGVGYIPEGSEGLWNLLQEYWGSGLHQRLHRVMDSASHEPHWRWDGTYRRDDYAHLARNNGIDVWACSMARDPVHNLLNPDVLNSVIYRLNESGWHPKHIAGLIRSVYEDPRMGYGGFFANVSAERHANGWVEIILGQLHEY